MSKVLVTEPLEIRVKCGLETPHVAGTKVQRQGYMQGNRIRLFWGVPPASVVGSPTIDDASYHPPILAPGENSVQLFIFCCIFRFRPVKSTRVERVPMSESWDIPLEQAEEIVQETAINNGWIDQEARENSHPQTLRALANVRAQLGNAGEMYVLFDPKHKLMF